MDIERIVVKLLADASSYHRVMDGVDARLRDFARRSESMTAILAAPFAVATQAVMSLTRALVETATGAVQAAMGYEELQIQLEVMSRSAEKGQQLMSDLFKTAVDTPFKVRDVVAAAKELQAFGVETSQINATLRTLGDVSAATGTPMHRLILAFGQTKIAGRLMGQEMRQFVNANVPMIEHLSAVMGKPTAQIKKMIENGQVGFDQVVKAINMMTGAGGVFEGMMDRMAKTTQGRWNSFVETLEIVFARAGGAFMKGLGLDKVFVEMRAWAEGLEGNLGDFEEFGKRTREAWDSVVAILRAVRDVLKFVIGLIQQGYNSVKKWTEENQGLVKSVAALVAITTTFRLVVWALTAAVTALSLAWAAFRAVMGINALISLVSGLVGAFTSLNIAIVAVVATAGMFIYEMWKTGELDGLISRLASLFEGLSDTVNKTWKGIVDAFKAGDIKLAFEVAWAGVKLGFMQMIAFIRAEWHRFINTAFTKAGALGAAQTWLAKDIASAEAWIKILNPWASDADTKKATKEYWEKIKELEKMREEERKVIDPAVEAEVKRLMETIPAEAKKELDRLTGRAARLANPINELYAAIEAYTAEWKKGQEALADKIWIMERVVAFDKGEIEAPAAPILEAWNAQRKFFAEAFKDELKDLPDAVKYKEISRMMAGSLIRMKKDYSLFDEGYAGRLRDDLGKTMLAMMGIGSQIGPGLLSGGRVTSSILAAVAPNQMIPPISISGDAKSLAMAIQQKYMRGVGEETHRFDFFQKNMGLINEAATGIPPWAKGFEEMGGFVGPIFRNLAEANKALLPEQADYGMLDELDKLRKYVGDRTASGPPVMFEGSSAAQETINRSNTQQTTVLENVRMILAAAKEMQARQIEIQAEQLSALKSLAYGTKPVAPMPRAVGFGAIAEDPLW